MLDCIIIGKGPAGLSAGIYTSMANLKTLIIGKESAIEKTDAIKNYFGFNDIIDGKKLVQNGIKQAISTGCEILDDMVISLDVKDGFFEVLTTKNGKFEAKAILLAVGSNRKIVQIDNLKKFEGKGISYCITCDGFFFKNKKVGVIGNTDYTINEANELMNYTSDITILTNGKELEASIRTDNVIDNRKIKSIQGDVKVDYIVFENNETEKFDGIFIAENYPTATEFVRKLGLDAHNELIKVDDNCMTSIKGIFAAGDIINEFKQISTAVGSGAISAKSIIKYCKEC